MRFYVNCLQVRLCLPLVLAAVSGNNISLLLMFLSLLFLLSLEERFPNFLEPGTGLMEDNGSGGRG